MKKQAFNPYLPNYEYIPDGEPRLFGNRLYLYGSHDRFGSSSFCENDYVLYSADIEDLSEWTYHGVIYRKEQDPLNKEKHPLFAPDVIQGKDHRYYLYYCPSGTRSIGVAVADQPEGPFSFLDHVKDKEGRLIGQRPLDPYPFDPAIFIEEDHIYLYIGFAPDPSWDFLEKEFGTLPLSPGPYVVKLEEDMHTIQSSIQRIEIRKIPDPGHDFLEASSLRKFDDLYYFIYSSMNSHELCYAISDHPQGPFDYKGILHDNGDIGLVSEENRVSYTGNNHGSLVAIKDRFYVFGHRQTNYSTYARQGIAETIIRDKDKTFRQAEMTSCGLNNGPLLPKGSYGSFIACHLTSGQGAFHYLGVCSDDFKESNPAFTQEGPDREDNPFQYITNMMDGSTAGFKYFEYCPSITLSISTRGNKGFFEVRTSLNEEALAIIPIEENKDFTQSQSVTLQIKKCDRFPLYFTCKGNGHIDFLSFTFH